MSKVQFQVSYGGEGSDDHSMEVQYLAPALLGLGTAIREANSELNDDRSKVKVLVQSDFEHKCFNIHLEVLQSIASQISSLLHYKNVETAKTILEWLGIIGALPSGGLIGFLKWKRGRRIKNVIELKDSSDGGDVMVMVESDDGSTIKISRTIYKMSENKKVNEGVAALFSPLQTDDFDRIDIRESNDHGAVPKIYLKEDAGNIIASCKTDDDSIVTYPVGEVVAHLRVHSPVFDPKATLWRFKYGEDYINVDISDTTIAADALRRGGVFVDDLYTVVLGITEHKTRTGQFRKSYKIIKVLDFSSASRQPGLFDGEE